MRSSTHTLAVKVFASVVLVGGAASVAGLGTFGAFTSSTSASESVSTGKVVLGLTQGVLATTVDATNVVPGDTIQRAVTLTRSTDTEKFGSVLLTTTASASPANLLTTPGATGLQLTVDQCLAAWTQVAGTNQLACADSGGATNILTSRPVIGTNQDLVDATTQLNLGGGAGGASNLRLSLVLPGTAGNLFQGLSNSITFTFDATQRTAGFR